MAITRTFTIYIALALCCFAWIVTGSHLSEPAWIEGPNGVGALGNRTYHSYVSDSRGNLWLFGGINEECQTSKLIFISWLDQRRYNDLWKLEPRLNYTWTLISNNSGPIPRMDQLMWLDHSDNIWIFGGTASLWAKFLSDLWMFNTTSLNWTLVSNVTTGTVWEEISSSAENSTAHPGGRAGSPTWLDINNNILWLFGGWTSLGLMNDVWTYDTESQVWTWISGNNSAAIPARSPLAELGAPSTDIYPSSLNGAYGAADRAGNVWIIGGRRPDNKLNHEFWRFNMSSYEWTWMGGNGGSRAAVFGNATVYSNTTYPPAAIGGALVYSGNNILTYSPGHQYQSTSYIRLGNTLWSYNISSNEWAFLRGETEPGIETNANYAKFQQADEENEPGGRVYYRGLTTGNLWLVRGQQPDQSANTFLFAVDLCLTDLSPCHVNAACTSHLGYADCVCNEGFEGDGFGADGCSVIIPPVHEPNMPSNNEPNNAPGSAVGPDGVSNALNLEGMGSLIIISFVSSLF